MHTLLGRPFRMCELKVQLAQPPPSPSTPSSCPCCSFLHRTYYLWHNLLFTCVCHLLPLGCELQESRDFYLSYSPCSQYWEQCVARSRSSVKMFNQDLPSQCFALLAASRPTLQVNVGLWGKRGDLPREWLGHSETSEECCCLRRCFRGHCVSEWRHSAWSEVSEYVG